MTSKTAADGDDYTWQAPGGAVLNSAFDLEPGEGWRVIPVTPLNVDLRTPDQRERDDVAELWAEIERLRDLVQLTTAPLDVALRVDTLVDELQALTWRVAALEQDMTTLRGTLERVFEIRL